MTGEFLDADQLDLLASYITFNKPLVVVVVVVVFSVKTVVLHHQKLNDKSGPSIQAFFALWVHRDPLSQLLPFNEIFFLYYEPLKFMFFV